MSSLAERPSSAAQQSSTAPTLSTDRPGASAATAPPSGSSPAGSYPHEDYRGWASL